MKVYVITRGAYSAYHICGVTLDLEEARKAQRFFTDDWENAYIETYDTDRFSSLDDWKFFQVVFDNSGSAVEVEEFKREDIPDEYPVDWEYNSWSRNYVCVFAKDEASAIKIAAEKRAVYLAEEEGI